jgi:ABC-type multidrug transport system permease subunit
MRSSVLCVADRLHRAHALQLCAAIVPARYFVDLSRGVGLKARRSAMWLELVLFVAHTAAVFVLAVWVWRFRRKVARWLCASPGCWPRS